MEVYDVLVFHLCEDVDLLLNVLHGDAPPARLHPLLFDILGRVLISARGVGLVQQLNYIDASYFGNGDLLRPSGNVTCRLKGCNFKKTP